MIRQLLLPEATYRVKYTFVVNSGSVAGLEFELTSLWWQAQNLCVYIVTKAPLKHSNEQLVQCLPGSPGIFTTSVSTTTNVYIIKKQEVYRDITESWLSVGG